MLTLNSARRIAARRAALVLGVALASACAQAEDGVQGSDSVSVNDQVSSYFRDYLSDPRRVGSLSGSIMGGALMAHPAGPILGSLIGFLIGKQSMFDEDTVRAQRRQVMAARRDIVPPDAIAPASATPVALAPEVPVALADAIESASPPDVQPAPVGLTREQVATICGGGMRGADPRLRGLCFYGQAD